MEYVIRREGNEDYLEHHGIKGQKWGVRRFENPDGTLTDAGKERYSISSGGNKRLQKRFDKEIRKLDRLRYKADADLQEQIAKKYGKRALRSGAIALGSAAVASGTDAVARSLVRKAIDSVELEPGSKYKEILALMADPNRNVRVHGDFSNASSDFAKVGRAIESKNQITNISNPINAVATLSAVAATGYMAYAGVRYAVAKRRISDVAHEKATLRAKNQVEKMKNMFANTPYAELINA